MAEDKFEQAVIDKLKSEGWEYLTDYSGVTVDRLYDHWRDILNANNRKRLEDTPLSDNEFEQVKLELTKNKMPYDALILKKWTIFIQSVKRKYRSIFMSIRYSQNFKDSLVKLH